MTNEIHIDRYRRDLILALRLHDVPGERIGEVLAEIEAHTQATGEHPEEAFGPPRAYAERVADAVGASPTGGWWHWVSRALRESRWAERATWLATMIGGYLLAAGLGRGVVGGPGWFGTSPWVLALVGAVVVALAVLLLVRGGGAAADPVRDPRSGEDVLAAPRGWKLVGLLAWPVAALLAITVVLHILVS